MFESDNRRAGVEERYGRDRRRDWFALATGVNVAGVVCNLVCKVPQEHTLSLGTRLRASVIYLFIACVVGAAGTWFMLPCDSRGEFRSLARCGVRGWVFLPAIVLFLRLGSVWAPLIAVMASGLMAAYLFRFTAATHDGVPESFGSPQAARKALFTTEVCLAPTSWVPFALSACLYGAVLEGAAGRIVLVTVLLAIGAFLFVLQTLVVHRKGNGAHGGVVDRGSRPYLLVMTGIFGAFAALSVPGAASSAFLGLSRAPAGPESAKGKAAPNQSSLGFQTIVLWPIEKKEKVIPSPPLLSDVSSPGIAKPRIIPFDGPYWYFKVPGDTPGPNARTTRGDPLKVNVRSTDRSPLLMEAHQQLSQPMELSCCRAMEVVFRNDASLGAFAVGLSLTDSHSRGKLTQSLGVKSIAASSGDAPMGNASPAEETLRFVFPKHGTIRKFDAITVILLPDAKHPTAGRKVAVERFVILPN